MARIRSVHPSFFTDEACVSCSPLARLLYIGLWTDADDQGVFEWRPLQLKMRLLPGDTADASELLAELLNAGLIAPFDHGGARFGAIREFRRFQRPKKPNSIHVLPSEWRTYVAIDDASGEPDGDESGAVPPKGPDKPPSVGNRFGTGGEIPPQMEDGGEDVGRAESVPNGTVSGDAGRPPPICRQADVDAIWAVTPRNGRERSSRKDVERALQAAVKRGAQTPEILAAVTVYYGTEDATKAGGQYAKGCHRLIENDRWREFSEAPDGDDSAPSAAEHAVPEWQQRAWAEDWRDRPHQWKAHERGPRPGEAGCRVSTEILTEMGIQERAA